MQERKYKTPEIPWLGKIPNQWPVKRLEYVAKHNLESLPESTPDSYEFNYIDIGNIDSENGIGVGERVNFANAPSRARRIVRKGDTIISTVRTYLKAVAYINFDPKDIVCSTGFAVLSPSADLAPKFLYYVLRSDKFINRVEALSVGVSYPAINSSELVHIPVWYPPRRAEQDEIVRYLDEKTSKIDSLISKKRRLLALLKEERAVVINNVITKGLNPDVELKDAGAQWLGKTPKHWGLKKIKYLVSLRNMGPASFQGGKKCIDLENIEGWTGRIINEGQNPGGDGGKCFAAGDVLFSRLRTYLGKVHRATGSGVAGGELFVLKPTRLLEPDFLFYRLVSEGFISVVSGAAYGTKMPRASWDFIGNLKIPYPEKDEQVRIIRYLADVLRKIDLSIHKQILAIKYLNEYRAALISEVVTGRIRVGVGG